MIQIICTNLNLIRQQTLSNLIKLHSEVAVVESPRACALGAHRTVRETLTSYGSYWFS